MPTVEINPSADAFETPTTTIIKAAAKTATFTDPLGRKIVIRRLMPSIRQRLRAIAGPELSNNEHWINDAAMAFAVVSIDGDPVTPNNIRELEVLSDQLDDVGLNAVSRTYSENFLNPSNGVALDTVKN